MMVRLAEPTLRLGLLLCLFLAPCLSFNSLRLGFPPILKAADSDAAEAQFIERFGENVKVTPTATNVTPKVWVESFIHAFKETTADVFLVATGQRSPPQIIEDSTVDMRGKVVVITGSNCGIGERAAVNIAKMGANVVLACRSNTKGKEAEQRINEEVLVAANSHNFPYASSGSAVYMFLDLGDHNSVREFANQVQDEYENIDVLINNAGTGGGHQPNSIQGIQYTFDVNFVAHFLLTRLLLPRLAANPRGARVVNLSSVTHRTARYLWDTYAAGATDDFFAGYADSKQAANLFTLELNRRLKDTNVVAFSANPGACTSRIWRGWTEPISDSFQAQIGKFVMTNILFPFFLSCEEGCATQVHAATQPLPAAAAARGDRGGGGDPWWWYLQPYRTDPTRPLVTEFWGPYGGVSSFQPALPVDEEKYSKALWSLCEELCGIQSKSTDKQLFGSSG